MFLMSSLFLSIALLSEELPEMVTAPGAGVPTGSIVMLGMTLSSDPTVKPFVALLPRLLEESHAHAVVV